MEMENSESSESDKYPTPITGAGGRRIQFFTGLRILRASRLSRGARRSFIDTGHVGLAVNGEAEHRIACDPFDPHFGHFAAGGGSKP